MLARPGSDDHGGGCRRLRASQSVGVVLEGDEGVWRSEMEATLP